MVQIQQPTHKDRMINEALDINWSNWDFPSHLPYSQRAAPAFWPTAVISPPAQSIPLAYADTEIDLADVTFPEPGTDRQLSATQLLDRRLCNDALLIMHKGLVIHESYRNGMLQSDHHINHSTTKSLTTLLLGLAIAEGLVDPAAPITDYLDELSDLPSWRRISVQQALDMRTGLDYQEHYDDPDCICWSYFRATGYYPPKPGTHSGYIAWIRDHMQRSACPPGEQFAYASPVTNALGLVAASAFGKPVAELLEEKIYRFIGAESDAWLNLDPSGVAVTEGQLSLRLRDFARWASLFLNKGCNLAGDPVIPSAFMSDITESRPELRSAWQRGEYSDLFPEGHYRNQTYVLNRQCSQLAMLGIHGQFCYIDLERELMILGYGSYPDQVGSVLVIAMQSLWQGFTRYLDQ
ncbi:MAG: serine hydrolase [Pseudomonadota bacterium]